MPTLLYQSISLPQRIILRRVVLMTIFNESFKLGSFWSEILIKKG